MAFTIKDALKLKSFEDCVLIAGHDGINRKITCIDTMEIPDITPWLKKGELLITTAYSIKGNENEALCKLIEGLYSSKSAGIMIKTRFIGRLPKQVLKAADELKMPVIEIPDGKPFIELTNALMKVIVNEQNMLLDYSEKVRKRFFDMEIEEGGLRNIGATLYEFLKTPVILFDNYNKNIFNFPEDADMPEKRKYDYRNQLEELFDGAFDKPVIRRAEDKCFYIKSVRLHGNICGYIAFLLKEESEPDEEEQIVLEHADTIMALEFSNRETAYHKHSIMDTNLLMDIILGNIKNEKEAEIRANYLKWQKMPALIAVIDIDGFAAYAEEKDEKENLFIKHEIFSAVRLRTAAHNIRCSIISESDRFICIFSYSAFNLLPAFFDELRVHIKTKYNLEISIGVSDATDKYTDIKKGYEDAEDALKIGRAIGKRAVFITEYALEQAIINSSDKTYLRNFVKNSVEKLKEYDAKNGTELFFTLDIFIKNMGVRTKTAEELYLHRNTLSYRLKKIENILGCDLTSRDKLIELGVAIRLVRLV